MKTGTIYGLLCPVEKRIVYVGQTCGSLSMRLCEHRSDSLSLRESDKIKWLKRIASIGLLHEIMIVCLKDNVSESRMNDEEFYWIEKIRSKGTIYNYPKIKRYSGRGAKEIHGKQNKIKKNRAFKRNEKLFMPRPERTNRKFSQVSVLRRRIDFDKWISKAA